MNLTRQNWPLGWRPSDDAVNGNPEGLLRMDNLRFDEDGCLTLDRGIKEIFSNFPAYVDSIYSKVINGKEAVWVSMSNGFLIHRSLDGSFTDPGSLMFSGGGYFTCFADALGNILIVSGDIKYKDNCGANPTIPLGLDRPSKPIVNLNVQPALVLQSFGSYSFEEGNNFQLVTDGAECYCADTTLRGIVNFDFSSEFDSLNFSGERSTELAYKDTFYVKLELEDKNFFRRFRVEFWLDSAGDNYYFYEWPIESSDIFNNGVDATTTLDIQRDSFNRHGNNPDLSWANVVKIKYILDAFKADAHFEITSAKFVGGPKGKLKGQYTYIQVNAYDNGYYVAKSQGSLPSDPVTALNSSVDVIPTDTETTLVVNKRMYFRRSVPNADPSIPELLDDYYLAGIADNNDTFLDELSDEELLVQNIKLNQFLLSLQDVHDPIIAIEGIYYERMLYLTRGSLLLSDRLNPDAIDTRYTLDLSGDPTEFNLWIKRLTNNSLLLATSKDIYEISGTLLDLPDGTLDINIRSIGENYPPLSRDVVSREGIIYYVAADGVRGTSGSNSVNISSPQLSLLFQNQARHGMPAILKIPNDNARYAMTIANNCLYVSLVHSDITRRLFVFDFIRKVWRIRITNPVALNTTPSDRVLLGYLLPNGNGALYDLDIGEGFTNKDGTPQNGYDIFLQTVFDSNGQPRNRKDTFTLKIVFDSGGQDIGVYIKKDSNDSVNGFTLLKVISSNGQSTAFINISTQSLGFRYAVRLQNYQETLTTFKLYEITLEYEPRPEQINYLRIPNNNFGTLARKRHTSFAFVIDTLGNDVTFTPLLDNISTTTSTANKNGKLTHKHFFMSEAISTDIGGILESVNPNNPFEFYGVNPEETISEKLPAPTKYLIIPANDYGSPNRKRHTSYKFQINTRGYNVRFTPKIDGTTYTTATFNTTEKRTVEYFFDTSLDVTGIDIGGILETLEDQEFEFYGVIVPQELELLPSRLKSLYIPVNNFGVASPKRLRTLPILIDTRGSDVVFTPIIDGIEQTITTTLNSSRKQTLYHYFINDAFGTDFSGKLIGTQPFEFYGFGNVENVEVLPVPKKYDQIGPLRLDKIGKFFEFRTRMITMGTSVLMPFAIYGDTNSTGGGYSGSPLYSGQFAINPLIDETYEIQLPKSINTAVIRIVFGPLDDIFHRYDMWVKVAVSGMQSDSKWIPIR